MLRMLFSTGLFAVMASSCLNGQSMKLRATVPFEFRAGAFQLPPGEYLIHGSPTGILVVQQAEGGKKSVVLQTFAAFPTASDAQRAKPALKFHRYGDKYFLSRVWDMDSAREFPKSRGEKELASRNVERVETASVPLRKQ